MKSRWWIAAGVVALGGGYLVLREVTAQPDTAAGSAHRSGQIALATPTGEPTAPTREAPHMVMTESGLKPANPVKQPREWRDPVTGAVNREVVDAVPDPEEVARQELTYRMRRMRLTLADAAESCYSGPDARDEIELEYTLVVEHEEIRADNVRVKRSELKDPTVERCILDAVRGMRALGDKIPDTKQEQGLVISLHDLWDRNRRANQAKAKGND
jgi:hypothetical protein